ncbi:MAG TPA: DUF3866 family protein [Firmicutes bacterium]|nr:DUF3866 family protein [Bacillota bacterium]
MVRVRKGRIIEITRDCSALQELVVLVEGRKEKALSFPALSGKAEVNDEVWLNTTAVSLGLGTGGYHFVMGVIGREERDPQSPGHIMKLRYTPWQLKVLSVEEESSPHHRALADFSSLEGLPVTVGTLHSMVAPVVMAFRAEWARTNNRRPKVVYIMTDGAALPIAFSRLVKELKARDLLDLTITCGHAFGGDLEAVNVYSALAAAKAVGDADLIVVAMGPGIVGTGTKYGFTGIEQAYILEAVERLGGIPVAVPRISFGDPRPRHQGLSHQTRTVLELTHARTVMALPRLDEAKTKVLRSQLNADGIKGRHRFYLAPVLPLAEYLTSWGVEVTSMGRSYREDPAFFDTAGVAGAISAALAGGDLSRYLRW